MKMKFFAIALFSMFMFSACSQQGGNEANSAPAQKVECTQGACDKAKHCDKSECKKDSCDKACDKAEGCKKDCGKAECKKGACDKASCADGCKKFLLCQSHRRGKKNLEKTGNLGIIIIDNYGHYPFMGRKEE